MPATLTPEVRGAIDEIRQEFGRIDDLENALQQQEEQARSLPAMIRTESRKAMAAFDGGRYRGMFASEDQAREFGLMLMGIGGHKKALEALQSDCPELHERTMTGADPSAGGSLVPTEHYSRLIEYITEYGVFAQKAFRWPMGSDYGRFPKISGELTVYCEGEGEAPTASDLTTGLISLAAKTWRVLAYYSTELSEDSAPQIGEIIARAMARAIAKQMDNCGFIGDGTSTYFNHVGVVPGITGTGTAGLVEFAGHDAYSEVTDSDLLAVMAKAPQRARNRAEWFCTFNFYVLAMLRLIRSSGGVTAAEMADGQRRLVYASKPVNIVEVMSTTEADEEVPVVYGDLSQAAMWGDRGGFRIKRSEHYKLAEGLMTVLGEQRIAINVHDIGDDSNPGAMVAGSLETTG